MEHVVIDYFEARRRKNALAQDVGSWSPEPLPKHMSGRLLDVGCGARFPYCSNQFEIYGIDITRSLIKLAKESYPKAHIILASARMLPFRREVFDVVVSINLLHHLVGDTPAKCKGKQKDALRGMKYTLRQNGMILIDELLARSNLLSSMVFWLTYLCFKFGIDIDFLYIYSKVVAFHLTKKDLWNFATENGLKVKVKRSQDWTIRGIKLGTFEELVLF